MTQRFLLLCIAFTLTVLSCDKSDDFMSERTTSLTLMSSNVELSPEEIIQKADSIGMWHNYSLAYVSNYFDSLKSQNWKGTEEQISLMIENKTLEYLKNQQVIPTDFYFNHDEMVSLESLSSSAQKMIDTIFTTVDQYFDEIITKESFENTLLDIKIKAANELIIEEAIIVAAGASVTLYSFHFWSTEANNYSIYRGHFYDDSNQSSPLYKSNSNKKDEPVLKSNNKREVLKADGKGAVRRAVGGAVTGSAAGGIGAVPGAIVGATGNAAYRSMIRAFEVTKGWDLWWLP